MNLEKVSLSSRMSNYISLLALCLILAIVGYPFAVFSQAPPSAVALPAGGTYGSSQNVILTPDRAATVYYTADNSVPTTASSVYSGPIPITSTTTLRFFARDASGNQEPVRTQFYRIIRSAWIKTARGGYGHMFTLRSDLSLWGWGWNSLGQLGIGTTENKTVPTRIGSDHGWLSFSTGSCHSLAIRSDHTLWAWGDNECGQLGNVALTPHPTPVQVAEGFTWITTTAGAFHSVAVRNDYTLWAWGANSYGQLGDDSTTDRHTPVQVGADSDWIALAAGQNHNLALKANGTLWTWGANSYGQLGDTSTTGRHAPVRVGDGNTWTAIGAGANHSVALKSDGTLWAWGANSYGQLGDDSTTDRNTPVPIDAPSTWTAIAAGDYNTGAVKPDGSLWMWGLNRWGGVDCMGTDRSIPVRIDPATDWVDVGAGTLTFAALKTDGTLWTLGYSGFGQLGDGTSIDRCTPGLVTTPPSAVDGSTIRLFPGWNFISLGLQPTNPQTGDVLQDIASKIRIVWGYNNTTKVWQKWVPGGGNNTLITMDAGKGYWIYAHQETVLTITGTPPGAVTLFPGWNLTGHKGTDGVTSGIGLSGIIAGTWDIVWTWENGNWMAKRSTGGSLPFPDIPNLYRGKAYWIKIRPGAGEVPWN